MLIIDPRDFSHRNVARRARLVVDEHVLAEALGELGGAGAQAGGGGVDGLIEVGFKAQGEGGEEEFLAGRLVGPIKAEGEALIRETGQVEGDITSVGLSIIPGGVFVGASRMQVPAELGAIPEDKPLTEKKPRKL